MEILRIIGLAFAAAVICTVLRQSRPEMALLVALAAGVTILWMAAGRVSAVVTAMQSLSQRAGIGAEAMAAVVKIIGVAFAAEFGAQACRDAGEGALALKVELGGRVIMLAMCVPLLIAVMDSLLSVMP